METRRKRFLRFNHFGPFQKRPGNGRPKFPGVFGPKIPNFPQSPFSHQTWFAPSFLVRPLCFLVSTSDSRNSHALPHRRPLSLLRRGNCFFSGGISSPIPRRVTVFVASLSSAHLFLRGSIFHFSFSVLVFSCVAPQLRSIYG
ncbi:hypothetical protein RJT34_19388 [Clitoria ternatea]|uniref:Uncharacterized protein n=1 Tax=Clitoria ternatea TaxID=43366 RepID=A0AAN9IRC1_CLITE